MQLEVEQKFAVDDAFAVRGLVEALCGPAVGSVEQVDRYFAHPARDFAQTDEALRIRTVGAASFVTYKGPKLDATTKTRRELELPLGDVTAGERFAELLRALEFTPVAEVRKTRTTHHGPGGVEVALDSVAGLGDFVEIELVTDEAGLDAARSAVAELAKRLRLDRPERRSYLELLLAAAATGAPPSPAAPAP